MMSMTQEIDQNVIHDEFIRLIKAHDYSYMYSEDNDVWAKAKASINSIGSMLGVLVGVCRIDPQELLDECLGMYTNEGDYHNLVRSEIKKWFKDYMNDECEHSFIDVNNDGLEQCRFCNEQNK
jgi:hypothetical protein